GIVIISRVGGKHAERLPERSVVDATVGIVADIAEAEYDLEIVERVTAHIELVAERALRRPHESRTDQGKQRRAVLLGDRLAQRLAQALEGGVRFVGFGYLDLDLGIGDLFHLGGGRTS